MTAAADPKAGGEAPLLSLPTAIALVLVAVFAFCALIVLLAWAPELQNGDNGETHALSRSAVGFAGLVEALGLEKAPVLVSRSRLPRDRRAGVLVATPPQQVDETAVSALGFAGKVLIVLPKWMAAPYQAHPGWVTRMGAMEPQMVLGEKLAARVRLLRHKEAFAPVLHSADPGEIRLGPLAEGRVDQLQSISGAGLVPVLEDQAGEIILAREAKTQTYILSDPDLLNNHGLVSLAALSSGLALLDALRGGDGPVIFDVTLDGLARERSILRLFFAPPLMGVTLCLAAAAALAGFQAFFRFGPMRREGRAIAAGKQAMVDNAAQLIAMADRQGPMAARYARLTAEMTARQLGVPRSLGGPAQAALLDRLAAQRSGVDSFSLLAAHAASAHSALSVSRIAARLYRWRREMTQ